MLELMEQYLAQGGILSCDNQYDCHSDYSDYMDRYDSDQHNDFDVDGDGFPD